MFTELWEMGFQLRPRKESNSPDSWVWRSWLCNLSDNLRGGGENGLAWLKSAHKIQDYTSVLDIDQHSSALLITSLWTHRIPAPPTSRAADSAVRRHQNASFHSFLLMDRKDMLALYNMILCHISISWTMWIKLCSIPTRSHTCHLGAKVLKLCSQAFEHVQFSIAVLTQDIQSLKLIST